MRVNFSKTKTQQMRIKVKRHYLYTHTQQLKLTDRCCVHGRIVERSFHKQEGTKGNIYFVKDRKEKLEANCTVIHHRPTCDREERSLIQKQPMPTKPFHRLVSIKRKRLTRQIGIMRGLEEHVHTTT